MIRAEAENVLLVDTAGLRSETMCFHPKPCVCGDIEDGVAFDISPNMYGGWVVSFEDFEQMYLAAKAARGS